MNIALPAYAVCFKVASKTTVHGPSAGCAPSTRAAATEAARAKRGTTGALLLGATCDSTAMVVREPAAKHTRAHALWGASRISSGSAADSSGSPGARSPGPAHAVAAVSSTATPIQTRTITSWLSNLYTRFSPQENPNDFSM